MKQLYTVLAAIAITVNVFAQSPEKMSYQAIIRDVSNNLKTNQTIGMQISILRGSITGSAVYVETQTPTTNINGLITIEIGNGTVVSGSFSSINWASGPYFIKTETDPNGGTSYTIKATSQLLSVPYALYAKTAGNGFSGSFSDLNDTPTTLAGYGITNGMSTSHAANGINSTNITNWNTAYGWGNHASAGYLTNYTETDPAWTAASANYFTKTNLQTSGGAQLHFDNLTNMPTTLAGYGITDAMSTSHAANGIAASDVTNWNTAYGWGNHATAGYLTSLSETDPAWTAASVDYYTKTNMQTSGAAQLHFDNLTNMPTTLAGYGITDGMSTGHAANGIAASDVTNWNTAYGWGDHASAGYLTSEVDGSVTNEIELPTHTGNSGKYLTTDGTSPSWNTLTQSTVGLANVENTALSTWPGSANLATVGTITTGTWHGTAIGASYIDWTAPGTIGSATPSTGAFTSLSASNGLTVSAGTVTIKPSGSSGTNGQVLTTNGSGVATWQSVATSSLSVITKDVNYTILPTDGFIITTGGYTFTLPSASSAGAGKIIYLYSTQLAISLIPASGDTMWDADGISHTTSTAIYNGIFISDGVSLWFQLAK